MGILESIGERLSPILDLEVGSEAEDKPKTMLVLHEPVNETMANPIEPNHPIQSDKLVVVPKMQKRPKMKPRWGIKAVYPIYLVLPEDTPVHTSFSMFTDSPSKGVERSWYYFEYDKKVYSPEEIPEVQKLSKKSSTCYFYEQGKLVPGKFEFTAETIDALSRVERAKLKERTGENSLLAIYRRFASRSDTVFILSLILVFIGVGLLYYFLWPGLNSVLANIWVGMESVASQAAPPALNVSYNATIGG